LALGTARGRIVLAFATLYIVWGSTYLGIRYAVETIPPVFMAGVRFLIAGVILYAYARWRGHARATKPQWIAGAIVGCLLMTSNAGVAVAAQRIPSGVSSLIVAMSALWFVLLEWLRPNGKRPTGGVIAGLVVGLAGVAILIGPAGFVGGPRVDTLGAVIVLCGTVLWSAGSIYSRQAPRPDSPLVTTATQMLSGGSFLLLAAIVSGQARAFDFDAVSTRSWIAFAYLLVFGSLAGYTAFVYLLQVSTPTKVGTYAYVNPMVAVFLGWAFGGEPVTPRILVASAVILSAVALITTFETRELPSAITRWTRESRVPPPPAPGDARDGDKRRTEDCAITEVA
jgi:drug/metabolite transporter (DMT)-like permease